MKTSSLDLDKLSEVLGVPWEPDYYIDSLHGNVKKEIKNSTVLEFKGLHTLTIRYGAALYLFSGRNQVLFNKWTAVYYLKEEKKVVIENVRKETVDLLEIYDTGYFHLTMSVKRESYHPSWSE